MICREKIIVDCKIQRMPTINYLCQLSCNLAVICQPYFKCNHLTGLRTACMNQVYIKHTEIQFLPHIKYVGVPIGYCSARKLSLFTRRFTQTTQVHCLDTIQNPLFYVR